MTSGSARPLPRLVLAGFALAGTSPLALVIVSLTGATGLSLAELVPACILGLGLFLAPLAIWLGYARRIASSGGLYAFTQAAGGERLARVQGWIWIVSYLLYLPYTVTYIVFYLLPYVLPLPALDARLLEVALPVALCLCVALAERATLWLLAALAALQVVAVLALGLVASAGPVAVTGPLVAGVGLAGLAPLVGGAAQVSLLLACLSLVVFLGADARRPTADLPWALGAGYLAAAVATLAGAFLFAHAGTPGVLGSWIPGTALARGDHARAFAGALGVLALLGIAAVIVAEFVALVRLGRAMLRLPDRTSVAVIAAFFVAADVASLANPHRFYTVAIGPSVAALYLSQLPAFAAYPLLGQGSERRRAGPWLLAAVAVAWSLFGLYGAVTAGLL